LKGKRIAVPGGAGSAGSFLVALRLESAGLTLNDVHLVNVGLPDQPAALANGSIDAAQMAEPYASQALAHGDGIALTPGALAGVNASGLLTSGAMLDQHMDLVVSFTAALMKAARDLHDGAVAEDRLLPIYAQYTGLAAPLLRGIPSYDFSPTFDLEVTRRDLGRLQAIMQSAAVLHLATPIPVDRLVDDRPATQAAK
jgi:NitT/TauT family transport system substrate-binding protein